jgi:hypothetical protein
LDPESREIVPVGATRRLLTIGPDGHAIVTLVPLITQQQVHDIYFAAATDPYEVEDPLDPEFLKYGGMPCVEVMIRKQVQLAARSGDAEVVMDRLLGRPKQAVESTRLNLTYEDHLAEIARRENLKDLE